VQSIVAVADETTTSCVLPRSFTWIASVTIEPVVPWSTILTEIVRARAELAVRYPDRDTPTLARAIAPSRSRSVERRVPHRVRAQAHVDPRPRENEWHDAQGPWFRSHGNERWEFDERGLMRRRDASINDVPIAETDRRDR
jgi:hypothetical protein